MNTSCNKGWKCTRTLDLKTPTDHSVRIMWKYSTKHKSVAVAKRDFWINKWDKIQLVKILWQPTVCKKIVRDQQGKFLWIKTYNWQENYFQSRGNWSFWSRTILLHTVICILFQKSYKLKNLAENSLQHTCTVCKKIVRDQKLQFPLDWK